MAKYGNIGETILDTLDDNLNNAPANSGVRFDFINAGITDEENILHFVAVDEITTLDNIIAILDISINITNEKLPFLTNVYNILVNTSPILEYLNIAINSDAKNMINNNFISSIFMWINIWNNY